ncbi:MAG: RecX family transcriptional regulator [Prevotella sp.]|nr:RecX family transcriptional regulator [Prevotella sp.]
MTYEAALTKLTGLCARAEYCAADLRAKMVRWELSAADQARAIDYLTKEGYINEQRFCRLFVRDKLRFNHWGRAKIRLAAAAKQLEKETVSDALAELDDEEYFAILRDELQRKARTLKAANDYDRRAKLFRFALSKGFTSREIADALAEL